MIKYIWWDLLWGIGSHDYGCWKDSWYAIYKLKTQENQLFCTSKFILLNFLVLSYKLLLLMSYSKSQQSHSLRIWARVEFTFSWTTPGQISSRQGASPGRLLWSWASAMGLTIRDYLLASGSFGSYCCIRNPN